MGFPCPDIHNLVRQVGFEPQCLALFDGFGFAACRHFEFAFDQIKMFDGTGWMWV